ncbi:hypothetical protein FACS189455_2720 [Bacteroidia bacterium]|nr:hypothetical protein FACS189455_2720 [Bacteroidia bacterium]
MKKKILIGFAALAIATVVALNVNISAQGEKLSDVSLANVEALADGEVSVGNICYYQYAAYCWQFWGTSDCELWLNMKPL